MILLKQLLTEYVDTETLYLYKYMKNVKYNTVMLIANNAIEELMQDLASQLNDPILKQLNRRIQKSEDDWDEMNSIKEDFMSYVFKNQSLIDPIYYIISADVYKYTEHYYDLDDATLLYMELKGIYKNDWILHFTDSDSAYKIQKEGFKYGMDNVEKLGLTVLYKKEAKKYGGFNFGFSLHNYKQYYKDFYSEHKYSTHLIMAKTSGVKVWHTGDEEEQIIFFGKTAKNIVLISHDDDDKYNVEDKHGYVKVSFENIEDVVNWVVNNYDQYKNAISYL